MNPLAHFMMLGCIPAILFVFSRLPAQRAVILCFIGAWMFLPWGSYKFLGLPEYTRMSATCYGILIGSLIFDPNQLRSFRPGLIDLPILVLCLCPFVSSMANDLGPYDGLSAALDQTVVWGFPYFLGRLYVNNLSAMRQLAIAIFAGGVIYIPFCLIEARLSPIFHIRLYGFYSYIIQDRFGGWRPAVFMWNGLMLGVWMMMASLAGFWLWRSKVINKLFGVKVSWLLAALILTFIATRALGAYVLLILGLLILLLAKRFKTILPLLLVVIAMCTYVFISASGNLGAQQRAEILSIVSRFSPPDRVQSLEFRLVNEEALAAKAREQPIFGWGGWGRARVYNEYGQDSTITDSLWIIVYGVTGSVGLVALALTVLIPPLAFARRYPPGIWAHPKVAPAAVLTVGLTMYSLDCVLNAMINPLFILMCGGLSGLVIKQPESLSLPATPKTLADSGGNGIAGPLPTNGSRKSYLPRRRPSPRRFLQQ